MTNEQKRAVEAAKEIVSAQITKREESKSVYFESSQKDGTVLTVAADSFPIEKNYAGNPYYTIKTTDNKDIVLSKLAQSDLERVFGLIGKQAFKLRADLIDEVRAISKRDNKTTYFKRIFEYSLVD